MEGKVLIIDDEPTLRLIVAQHLERAGFETVAAAGGAEAISRLEAEPFDVAIVDLGMPGVSGLEVLRWMQQHTPKVVPVVLSGTSSVEDAVQAVQQGAFDFVAKPITSPEVFVQHVQRAVTHGLLRERNAYLLEEREGKNVELENRLAQLELAHSVLQSQALALQADMNRAMRLQYALLPKSIPFPERLSLSVVFRPMTKVGGDLYDMFPIGERRVGLYVADTAGHGVSAAMLAVFLKLAVKHIEGKTDAPTLERPAAVLRALNQMLFDEEFGHDIFISMTYLVVDVETREATYAAAGHPALLLRRHDGPVEVLREPAPALGLNPNVRYVDSTFTLEDNDVVVLYTDGVLDTRTEAGQFYGRQRLADTVARAEGNAETVTRYIENDLLAFRGRATQGDDLTIVALGAAPQPAAYQPPKSPEEGVVTAAKGAASTEVRTARDNGCIFINVTGPGSLREGQQVLELIREARAAGKHAIILDLAHCPHLDSTFHGILHNLATSFAGDDACRFEIQNITPPLLREMSELGLTSVLMHFRSTPVSLPSSMRPIDVEKPEDIELGRLLLRAHEALVEADPKNADRFAAVLEVLHAQVKPSPRSEAARE